MFGGTGKFIFELNPDDWPAILPEKPLDLPCDFRIEDSGLCEIVGVIAPDRLPLFQKPIREATVPYFAVVPRATPDPPGWTNSLYGFPPTIPGQVSFMATLAQIVKSVPNNLGIGVFYWGSEYQEVAGVNEAGFNTASFFDSTGEVLPVVDALGGMGAPLVISASLVGSNVQLTWPFSGAACRLMKSTSLASSAIWSPLISPVQTEEALFTITVPIGNDACFYRLQSN